jgi:hypothetical protein
VWVLGDFLAASTLAAALGHEKQPDGCARPRKTQHLSIAEIVLSGKFCEALAARM